MGLSQIYLSSEKLAGINKWFHGDLNAFDPIYVRDFNGNGELMITDGHTRAFAAWKAGFTQIPVLIDNDVIYKQEVTLKEYLSCIEWCERLDLKNVADLEHRVLNKEDYVNLWDMRCDRMQNLINGNISGKIENTLIIAFQEKIKKLGLFLYGCSEDLKIFFCENRFGQSFSLSQEACLV